MNDRPTHGLDPSALAGYREPDPGPPSDAGVTITRALHSRKFWLTASTGLLVLWLVAMYIIWPGTRAAEPAITRTLTVWQVLVMAYIGMEGGADLISRWRR